METALRFRTLAPFVLGALLAASPSPAQSPPRVHVAQGDLVGMLDHGADAFLGIPYAAPPVGGKRWQAPAPPSNWRGARDARHFGPACMQPDAAPLGPWSIEYFVGGPYDEDCLSLNVWTTAAPAAGQAVVLFVPGGGFNQGGGGVPIYNGAAMARAGVVFVSMNYRLGPAGFLATPELAAESPDHTSGNYTLYDVLAALTWIRTNIAAFGGDPTKVTVMGQSAGAAAINALLHAPLSKGLFRAAILDSGVRLMPSWVSNADREKMSGAWAASKGAATLAQMRALPAAAMIQPHGSLFRFGPSTDGAVLPESAAPFVDVPVLTGWNAAEGAAPLGKTLATPIRRDEFAAIENQTFGPAAQDLLALYPSGDDATEAAHAAGHDAMMMTTAAWAAGWHNRVYLYDFEHVMPGDGATDWGSYHSSELPYVFGTLSVLGRPWTDADQKVAATLRAYWVNFIKTGDPNGQDLPKWTIFELKNSKVMALGDDAHMRPIASPKKLEFYERASR